MNLEKIKAALLKNFIDGLKLQGVALDDIESIENVVQIDDTTFDIEVKLKKDGQGKKKRAPRTEPESKPKKATGTTRATTKRRVTKPRKVSRSS